MEVQELSCSYADEISTMYQEIYDASYLLGSVYQSPKLANYLKHACQQKSERFIGIIQDDQLAAVLQYRRADTYIYGNHLVVRPEYQGMGFAKKLMFYLFDVADSQGLEVKGDVNPSNKDAFAWYLAVGYTPVDECNYSVLKIDSQNPSTIEFEDTDKYNNFGISNSRIKDNDLESLEFFSIAPHTLVLKTSIEPELINKLCDSINGLLVIRSDVLTEQHKAKSILDRGNVKIVRPPASK